MPAITPRISEYRAGEARLAILGPDYAAGQALAARFAASGAEHLCGASVWHIEQEEGGFLLSYSQDGASSQVEAAKLIVATGALERPMPLPGWTLPGVTTTGALQILLKSAGIVEEDAASNVAERRADTAAAAAAAGALYGGQAAQPNGTGRRRPNADATPSPERPY